ncbi:T9SS type A sorting domain-containing protein [bacterium AH-315-M05]|nr:T9SS type A sorting domain-containing protein [bacterium AH-315-M05]
MKVLMNRYILIFISTFVLRHSSVAQVESKQNPDFVGEVLLELQVNPQLIGNGNNSLSASFKTAHTTAFFLLDTINLPFIDDFSTNLLKSHDPADYPDSLVFDSVAYDFQVDGFYPDTLLYSDDTTWNYTYDTSSSVLDSTALTQLEVIYFNDPDNPFMPTDTSYLWPPYNTYDTIPPGPPADTIYLSVPITLPNQIDTIKVYPPDSVSLWVDNYAFINSTYPIDPVTIGVATLDGVDEYGRPYDFSMPQTYGIADYLTSKPIDLVSADSVYLSFFYQPEGIGNDPQPEDSLVLEFYSPSQSKWFNIWSVEGSPNQNFNRVMIPIADAIYLKKGFQFRFKNYATLSGNLDHWHIEYVHIDAGRSIDDTVIADVAFVNHSPRSTLLENYQSMPWKHFLSSPSPMVDFISVTIANFDTTTRNVGYRYKIRNVDSVFSFPSGSNNIDIEWLSDTTRTLPVNANYTFFSLSTDSAVFEIVNMLNTSNFTDINKGNDTIRFYQRFYNYYAYDDGTAEAGYGLNTIGAQLAYRFTLDQPDTLRAVQMYFNQQLNDVSQEVFYLTVWGNEAGGPGNTPLYQKAGVKPVYEDSLNKFHTYLIDDTVIVLSDTFYIGWVQTTDDLLNIGFDRNINSNAHMLYNVTGIWQNSILPGSWMIRPVFGDTVILSAGVPPEIEQVENFNFNIYPNPAKDRIYLVNMPTDNFYNLQITIYDTWGREVYSEEGGGFIDISNLSEGIYMIRITDFYNHNSSTKKMLIVR